MNLYHYSSSEVRLQSIVSGTERWKLYSFGDRNPKCAMKPVGLWVSHDDESPSWPEYWLHDAGMTNRDMTHRHRVELHTESVLLLDTPEKILGFGEEYLARDNPLINMGRTLFLDWQRVMHKWDGILITPYQWSLRMDDRVEWYYTWDCASGCIWRKRAIKSIELVADNPWASDKYRGECSESQT